MVSPASVAEQYSLARGLQRIGLARGVQRLAMISVCSIAALFISSRSTQNAIANGDTRTISIQHMHTKELTTVTFRRDGRYVGEALDKLNYALRDWRNDDVIKMDPRLFDIAWEVHRELGSSSAFHVVSAYRSPGTNAMLRRRSRGVAKHSQHMEGKAMDFYLPGASSTQVRAVGMKLQRGGVGYYPTANTPFVHLDVGSVRSWPRMPRDQLARLFPSGNTVHIAADGRPLEGYEAAKAQILARGGSVGGFGSTDFDEGAIMQGSRKSLWASLFGWNEEEEVAPARGRAARGRSSQQQVLAYAPTSSANNDSGDVYAMLRPAPPSVARVETPARNGTVRGRAPEATQVAALPAAPDEAVTTTSRSALAETAKPTVPAPAPVPNTPRFVAAPFPVARPTNLAPVQMAAVQPGSTGSRLNWQQGPAGVATGTEQVAATTSPAAINPAPSVSASTIAAAAEARIVLAPLPPRRPDVAPAVQLSLASAVPVNTSAVVTRDPPGRLVSVKHPAPPERQGSAAPTSAVMATVPLRPAASSTLASPPAQDRQALSSLFAAVATGAVPASTAKVTTTRARVSQPQAGQVEVDTAPAASLGFSQREPNDTRVDRFSGPAVRSLPTNYISR